jgi:phytol kinase
VIHNVWIAFLVTLTIALVWLRLVDFIAHRGWISSALSRKIIHAGTGLIFVLCWLLFPDHPASRLLASVIPLGISVQFALVGFGVIKDQASVDAMSRSGNRREILRGPLFYGIVFVALTLIFWKASPIGIIALMMLCGGDGLADIIGSRVKSLTLPWSTSKSLVGSLAMFFGGWIFSFIVLAIYIATDTFLGPLKVFILPITIISLAAAIVESISIKDFDNLTVPAISILLGYFLF